MFGKHDGYRHAVLGTLSDQFGTSEVHNSMIPASAMAPISSSGNQRGPKKIPMMDSTVNVMAQNVTVLMAFLPS